MPGPVTLTEIATISRLYRLKKLHPPETPDDDEPETSTVREPSQQLNDKISVYRGDITKLAVDAIVNAANESLRGGGGVDGAIHRAAGPDLLKECRTLGGCDTGSAKVTDAYRLPCKKVIHAVGPVYYVLESEQACNLLASCYSTSLRLAVENQCRSIAFSCLSTGVYGFPSQQAAQVAVKTTRDFLLGEHGKDIDRVVFCTFEMKDVNSYNFWVP
jgi:O-acetyl-ADP-ribose deacetylase (regulator of RNase III)